MNIKGIITSAFILALITFAVGLSGCEKIVSVLRGDKGPQVIGKEIPIGVIVSLTGKDAESYGLPMQRGFELAREEINNMQLGGESSLLLLWTIRALKQERLRLYITW